MSIYVRLLSVREPKRPPYVLGWPLEQSDNPPADPFTAAHEDTPLSFPYFPLATADDEFWNSFFTRVPAWELRRTAGTGSLTAVPDITVDPGAASEAGTFNIGMGGASGWTRIGPVIPPVIIGSRTAYIKKEERLPYGTRQEPDENEDSFQYSQESHWTNSLTASVSLYFTLRFLFNSAVRYGPQVYVPYDVLYRWTYTDDGFTDIQGGFLSRYSDLPFLGTFGAGSLSTQWRLGERTYGNDNHQAHGFDSYEFCTPAAGGGTTSTIADVTSMEVGGHSRSGNVWIQPLITDESYFGCRIDNGNDTTATYFPASGHYTSPKGVAPTMNAEEARKYFAG